MFATMIARTLAVAVLAAVAASASFGLAKAQTATNLKCRGCVGAKDLGRNAVRSKHIKNGTIKPVDLGAGAKPAGADSTEAITSVLLLSTRTNVLSTTVTAPSSGFLVPMATWHFAGASPATAAGFCFLNTATSPDGSAAHTALEQGYTDAAALNRMFPVSAGDTTVTLSCEKTSGTLYAVAPTITALFVPNRY